MKKLLSVLAAFSSALSFCLAVFLAYVGLQYFDTSLSFIPVALCAVLHIVDCASNSVNSRLLVIANPQIEASDLYPVATPASTFKLYQENGIDITDQADVFMGQCRGLLVGGAGSIICLIFFL